MAEPVRSVSCFSPKSHQKSIKEELIAAGVAVESTLGGREENGQIRLEECLSWPKDQDHMAKPVLDKHMPSFEIPTSGGILSIRTIEPNSKDGPNGVVNFQIWNTKNETWLIRTDSAGKISASRLNKGNFASHKETERYLKDKIRGMKVKHSVSLWLHDVRDEKSTRETFERFGLQPNLKMGKDGFYYWEQ